VPWIYTPEIVYVMTGRRMVDQLGAEGLDVDLTPDQVRELARASIGPSPRWVDRVPELSPEGRKILDRLAAERDAHLAAAGRRVPDQRPRLEQDQARVEGEGRGTPAPGQLQDQAKALDHALDPGPSPQGDPAQTPHGNQDKGRETAPERLRPDSVRGDRLGRNAIDWRRADQPRSTRRSRNGAGQNARTRLEIRDHPDDEWS
jgi:hypothetical protein